MAVRRRVDSLNKTIRQRAAKYRPRKDIRQVFADVEVRRYYFLNDWVPFSQNCGKRLGNS